VEPPTATTTLSDRTTLTVKKLKIKIKTQANNKISL
jgi:hypothetical protein